MPGHRLADLRSLALHRAVAAKLRREPGLVLTAQQRVVDRQADGSLHPTWAARWASLLALPVAELARALEADTPEMADVRQSSPFAGILTARERWQIWREVKAQP